MLSGRNRGFRPAICRRAVPAAPEHSCAALSALQPPGLSPVCHLTQNDQDEARPHPRRGGGRRAGAHDVDGPDPRVHVRGESRVSTRPWCPSEPTGRCRASVASRWHDARLPSSVPGRQWEHDDVYTRRTRALVGVYIPPRTSRPAGMARRARRQVPRHQGRVRGQPRGHPRAQRGPDADVEEGRQPGASDRSFSRDAAALLLRERAVALRVRCRAASAPSV